MLRCAGRTGFWEAKTRTTLQSLLHVAARDHCPPAELLRWTLDPAAAHDDVSILLSIPAAATGWGDALRAMLEADPRTRDSIWQGVSLSLGALAEPRMLDALSPPEGEEFDPAAFLRSNGTLYLLDTGAGSNNSAALVSAFVEDLVETARRIAARSAGSRLNPPLLLALNEIGNLAPLPSLPTLMAKGGSTGITTMPVLESLAQARAHKVERQRGQHHLGLLHRQNRARRSIQFSRPARSLDPDRRPRQNHRLDNDRRSRVTVIAAFHPLRADHAARHHPYPAVRHRPDHVTRGPTYHRQTSNADHTPRCQGAAREPRRS